MMMAGFRAAKAGERLDFPDLHGAEIGGTRRYGITWFVLMVVGGVAMAEAPLPVVSRAQLRAEVARLETVVTACKAQASGCEVKALGPDEMVAAEGSAAAFVMRWDWLRDGFETAVKAKKAEERVKTMEAAAGRLQEIDAEVAGGSAMANDFGKAKAMTTEVLSRAEFQGAAQPSWLDRQIARFWAWVGRLFEGVGALGAVMPWLGTALEVLLYVSAAVGVALFVRRAFAQQRLAVALGAGAAKASAWDKEAADWAALADACAAQQEWRDAVHCLYWAAIVRLESKRAWRHNPARTPREYVRLLKPGSAQQGTLRSLTQIFERVWYGLRDASDDDYRRARSLFEGLSEIQRPVAAGETA